MIVLLLIGLIINIACFLVGFQRGVNSFFVRMKIASLKEENARLRFAMHIDRSFQKAEQEAHDNDQH